MRLKVLGLMSSSTMSVSAARPIASTRSAMLCDPALPPHRSMLNAVDRSPTFCALDNTPKRTASLKHSWTPLLPSSPGCAR